MELIASIESNEENQSQMGRDIYKKLSLLSVQSLYSSDKRPLSERPLQLCPFRTSSSPIESKKYHDDELILVTRITPIENEYSSETRRSVRDSCYRENTITGERIHGMSDAMVSYSEVHAALEATRNQYPDDYESALVQELMYMPELHSIKPCALLSRLRHLQKLIELELQHGFVTKPY